MRLFFGFFLAGIPSALIIFFFYRMDKRKPEPLGLIGKSVAFGLFAVIPAAIFEYFLSGISMPFSPVSNAFIQGFIVAGLVEESVKFFFVKWFIFNKKEFDEVLDGIVYSICISLGFAFIENLLYGYSDTTILLIRGFTSVPLHAAASGIMGYYIGISKCEGKGLHRRGLFYAVLVHGAYDFFIFLGGFMAIFSLLVLIVSVLVLLRFAKIASLADRIMGRS
jgi:RsiW-degrading membrane proteinase PrsW (M82 family)